MPAPSATPAVSLSRPVIRGLMVLNAVYALAIGALLAGTFVFPRLLFAALAGLEGGDAWQVHAALRTVVVLGLVGAAIAHAVLRHLLAIVDTVRDGDPFVVANARRLRAIAWWVMGGEGLRFAVAATIRIARAHLPTADIDAPAFSFAPWLAVLLLFVLAGVFAQGARMRADLDGTV